MLCCVMIRGGMGGVITVEYRKEEGWVWVKMSRGKVVEEVVPLWCAIIRGRGGWRVWWVIMREGYNRIGVGYDKRWGCSGL